VILLDELQELKDLDIKKDVVNALGDFYNNYIVETANGTFQVFQSFTYGEMVISFLLAIIIFIMILKWITEVIS
jgi:hypothetical protein